MQVRCLLLGHKRYEHRWDFGWKWIYVAHCQRCGKVLGERSAPVA